MLFPWIGTFEKIKLADMYIHYDDVSFSKGSFVNRVRVKTATGSCWLSVPLRDFHKGTSICQVEISKNKDWRTNHINILNQHYRKAPFFHEMLEIVMKIYSQDWETIDALSIASIEEVCKYFNLLPSKGFMRSSQLGIGGQSSHRLVHIVGKLGGKIYICGYEGAHHYLNQQLFENSDIRVEYINYKKIPYPQLNGEFTPYLSILDLIANLGKAGSFVFQSNSVYWQEYISS